MNSAEYLARLEGAGFTTGPVWMVPHFGQSVNCYRVNDPNGHLLTTMILWETPEGVVPYFCAEGVGVGEDIEDLKGLWAKRIRLKQSPRPVMFKSRAVPQPDPERKI